MTRLTYAPLPDWGDIASIASSARATDAALAAPWLGRDETPFWLSRSAWSLQMIARFRSRVTAKETVRVWIPDYFCNESLRPLRDAGVALEFYPVTADGSADLDACAVMLAEGAPDLVVAVHYFGQPNVLAGLARLAHDAGAWLVEDAAHALRPAVGIGELGDFVLYSPHKVLPIPDGALLMIRHTAPGKVSRDALVAHDFAGLHASAISEHRGRAAYGWLAKRVLQRAGVRANRTSAPSFEDDGVSASRSFPPPRMSALAKTLLSRARARLDEEAKTRVANKDAWQSRLRPERLSPGGLEFLAAPHVPYLLGMRLPNPGAASRAFDLLHRAGIPAASWPDLPPEVVANPARHQAAIAMRATRVFLPVHRSLDPAAIASSAERVGR